DRQAAARYGLNVADIQDVIEMVLGGKPATQLWEGERHFAVTVRLKDAQRTIPNLEAITVATPGGAYVPLSQVAEFKTVGGAMNIAREDGVRVYAIGVFIADRDMGSVVADMKDRVAEQVKLKPGYRVTWSGEFENQERAMARLAIIIPVAVLLIFILLFDAFGRFSSAALILLNIPFALIGGIFALLVTGIPLSVMVAYFNQLRAGGMPPEQAVIQGSLVRMRTVLMTGLLAMLGLLPMAVSTGIGSETQKPLAVVVIGGLVTATLLTLIVLPVLYLAFQRQHPPRHAPPPGQRASGV